MSLSKLFDPVQLGGLGLSSRVVMAPMTRSMSPSGVPGENVAAYYARRARAGVGLIVTEGTAIERPASIDDPDVPHFYGEAALAGWSRVVAAVHAEGGRIFPQLWHVGATHGRRSQWAADAPIESPSGLMGPDNPFGGMMTEADIADTVEAYARAARTAVDLGFDGVEIHAAHGYLIDQFFWAGANRREDRYGGRTLAERTCFVVEILRAVRREIGPEVPVSLRISQFKQQDYSARLAETPEELATMLEPIVDAGASIIHCSERRFWEPVFEGSHLNLAGWSKKITGQTVITCGSVGLSGDFLNGLQGEKAESRSLDDLLQRLEVGEFDLVAIGRALLGDPAWVEKMRDNRQDEVEMFHISKREIYY